jgi:hypothetical protein
MPQALFDARLMARFPGRTLEELDGMDYGRVLKAFQAGHIEGVETRRALWVQQKAQLTDDDWAAIREHDDWLAAHVE